MTRPFKANPARIYFTDNGRALCGAHLGASAFATGRDISGQRIQAAGPVHLAEWNRLFPGHPLKCEQCGKVAS